MDGMLDQEHRIDDLTKLCYEFALDAIGVMFIGSKLKILQGSEYGKVMIKDVNTMFEMFLDVAAIPPKIAAYVPVFRRYLKIVERVYMLSKEKIDEAKEKHKVDGSLNGTVLGKMIERCGPDSEIPAVMANDALLAGVDTTGNTIAFLLYHLAVHPDKQEKLYQEIVRVVGKDGKMTEDRLAEMRFLKACQQESARMCPVALGSLRNPDKDIVLNGYQIPKDTTVFRLGFIMSNDAENFKEPEKFMPERWMRGRN